MSADASTRPALPEYAGDAILVAGGARAILLQLAYPPIGRGVARPSDFQHRPLDRLWATLSYVYAVGYGTPDDRRLAVRAVNRAHGPVRSVAGESPYSAFDPELQLWVTATLYDTAVTVQERLFGPLDDVTADLVYAEYARLGTSLQLPPEFWPADRTAFAAYWRDMLARLAPDAEVRRLARALLFPTRLPFYLRPLMPAARLITAGLLPATVRAGYRVRWDARAEARLDRLLRLTGRVWPLLPRRLRHWPKEHTLRLLRMQAAAGG